ncbi:hypothetical protein JCM5296_002309 [Sporobolomyces johnsonii]
MGTIACPRPVRPNPPPPCTNNHPPRHFRTPSFPHAHTTQPTSHPPYQRSTRTSSSLSSLVKSCPEPPFASKGAGSFSRHSTASSASSSSSPPPPLAPISTKLPTSTCSPSTTPATAATAAADPTALDEFFSILSLEPIAAPSPALSPEAGSPIAILPASPSKDNGARPRSAGGRRRNSNSVSAAGGRSKSPGPNVMLGIGGTGRLMGRRTPPVVKGGDGLLYSPPSRALTRNPFSRHASSAILPSPAPPLLSPSLLPPPSAPSHGRHVQVEVPTASRINSLQLERPALEKQGGQAGGRKASRLREMEVEVAVEGEAAVEEGGM